jgi:hypothetical protein
VTATAAMSPPVASTMVPKATAAANAAAPSPPTTPSSHMLACTRWTRQRTSSTTATYANG